MNIKKIAKRIMFHLFFLPIKVIFYFNHRVYMRLYVPLLKRQGINLEGMPRYIGANVVFDDFSIITLGDRVVISDQCHLLTHDYSVTTALIAIGKMPEHDIALIRSIKIGNNVFIGKKALILPNTKIGDNCIIGAGSVIRGDIASGSIVIGNPHVIVGSIYDQARKWEKYLSDNNYCRIDK